ncbi:MAG: hypothetical protein ACRDYZ_12045 [Acidimicrobiales bacterium]
MIESYSWCPTDGNLRELVGLDPATTVWYCPFCGETAVEATESGTRARLLREGRQA